MVNTFLSLGKGHAGMEKFCMGMCMPLISASSYNAQLLQTAKEITVIHHSVLQEAQTFVCQSYVATDQSLSEGDIIDITVSWNLVKRRLLLPIWHRGKWEYNETVHQLFIDFKKAYDSVRREVLYNILIEFGILLKLVRLIKM
jgi:hypothetical protein